ncbi:MAG: hypothetical protein E7514_07520 [Ruminococcaceae bacterium]|nr:hypothetical protein [Oscillospiraceae bacterium]
MKQIVFEECPYCHSKLLAAGYQNDGGAVYSDFRGGVFGTAVQHTVCIECGSIVYSRVLRVDGFKEFLTDEGREYREKIEKEKPKKKKEGILEIIVDD